MSKLTIADVRDRNTSAGFFFFSRDAMRFFSSRVESSLYSNGCFITSESEGFVISKRRKYSVHWYNPQTHSIDAASEFCQFSDISDARAFARAYVPGGA